MITHCAPPTTASAPTGRITLDVGTVHVWSAQLDCPPSRVRTLAPLLSSGERERAQRLRLDRDRTHFVVRRGLLRIILGRYVGAPPETIAFQYGEWGKPAIEQGSGVPLGFNLSYSHGLALYAIARGREVGVDIERVRDGMPHADLAERYFSAPERAELRRLPAGSVASGFFNGWTRKESYVKALGTGLVTRLDSFSVSLTPGEPAELLSAHDAATAADGWTLANLDAPPGHSAAITIAGSCERIVQRSWDAEAGVALEAGL
jgi:4'-phosphopantetheinyl transferase